MVMVASQIQTSVVLTSFATLSPRLRVAIVTIATSIQPYRFPSPMGQAPSSLNTPQPLLTTTNPSSASLSDSNSLSVLIRSHSSSPSSPSPPSGPSSAPAAPSPRPPRPASCSRPSQSCAGLRRSSMKLSSSASPCPVCAVGGAPRGRCSPRAGGGRTAST